MYYVVVIDLLFIEYPFPEELNVIWQEDNKLFESGDMQAFMDAIDYKLDVNVSVSDILEDFSDDGSHGNGKSNILRSGDSDAGDGDVDRSDSEGECDNLEDHLLLNAMVTFEKFMENEDEEDNVDCSDKINFVYATQKSEECDELTSLDYTLTDSELNCI